MCKTIFFKRFECLLNYDRKCTISSEYELLIKNNNEWKMEINIE